MTTAPTRQRLTAQTAPAVPAPAVDVPEPLTEPRRDGWEETPAEAARYDRYHFDRDED